MKAVIIAVALALLSLLLYQSNSAAPIPSASSASSQGVENQFVGSASCGTCHAGIYSRWEDTLMANVLVDPSENPEVILGDFSVPNPLVTFSIDDVAFTYGSKWKQLYFTLIGDDYFVFPAQWDVQNEMWRRYYVEPGTDWWAEHYPADQMQRPTGPLCDGCHSTNYNIETKQVTEWNVGCEKCHGAGSAHASGPSPANIVNPARLDHTRGVDVCIQCHSQGQPQVNPINDVYYDWPVGYQPGDRLIDTWKLEEHQLGEESFTHWPEGSAHKNRMQGNDFVTSAMYTKGVACWSCHDVHGTENNADLIKPANAVCLTCHGPNSPSGPRGTIEDHTHHPVASAGSQCVSCHMPQIARTVSNVSVRSHTFRFITPGMTEQYGVANACTTCHAEESNEWAMEELSRWENVSPWRVSN
jgi:predicted CXXCH cytochrome family protein